MTDGEMIECAEASEQMARLRAIMHRLRAPGGCPWDAEQTHESLVSNMLEEAYEAVDAIQRADWQHLKEELGDVLLQVVFHAELAQERGEFNFDDIARVVSEKLIRRHPHVYSSSDAANTADVLTQWEDIKRKEKGTQEEPYLHGVGDGLPGLLKAMKLQKKAGKVGFDWPDAASVMGKVKEELAEVEEELLVHEEGTPASVELEKEIGDLLFVTVNLARKLKIDPEAALARTNEKFLQRFRYIEGTLEKQGLTLDSAEAAQMDREWENAKKLEASLTETKLKKRGESHSQDLL